MAEGRQLFEARTLCWSAWRRLARPPQQLGACRPSGARVAQRKVARLQVQADQVGAKQAHSRQRCAGASKLLQEVFHRDLGKTQNGCSQTAPQNSPQSMRAGGKISKGVFVAEVDGVRLNNGAVTCASCQGLALHNRQPLYKVEDAGVQESAWPARKAYSSRNFTLAFSPRRPGPPCALPPCANRPQAQMRGSASWGDRSGASFRCPAGL